MAALAGMALALTLAPALADTASDIERINRYLADWQRFSARFYQESGHRQFASGILYLSRPGRIRVEYDPPTRHRILADGEVLTFYDGQLDSVTRRSIDETPAAILLDANLGRRFEVEEFQKKDGRIRLRVRDRQNPDAGPLELIFDEDPLALKQWTVVDRRGVTTRVTLFDMKRVASFDPDFFRFDGLRLERIPFGSP